MVDYSVIIRTTGNAGEKYRALLKSINALAPQPKEVIVVLPEGNACPEEQLGWETFYYSQKGMVIQRMTGIEKCRTRYALLCDDDIQFGADFVEKLYEPIKEGLCGISTGPLLSFFPPKGPNAWLCAVMGSAVPTWRHRNRYVSILRTTGYSYNRDIDPGARTYYETQSAAWTCFFADLQAVRDIAFEEEIWVDSHGYAALDDQTMFYKAYLREIKTVVVADAAYVHLDARTSSSNNRELMLYALNYNRIVFWHRLIYSQEKNLLGKCFSVLCIGYRSAWSILFDFLDLIRRKKTVNEFKVGIRGLRDGRRYLKAEEYRNLPPACKEVCKKG